MQKKNWWPLSRISALFAPPPSLTNVVLAGVEGRQGRPRPVAAGLAQLQVDVLQGTAAAGVGVVVLGSKLVDLNGRLVCRRRGRASRAGRAGAAAATATTTAAADTFRRGWRALSLLGKHFLK